LSGGVGWAIGLWLELRGRVGYRVMVRVGVGLAIGLWLELG
jgi:hypothetical protein